MNIEEKELYEKALSYATEKHAGQVRIGGLPYITHPVEVAEIVKNKGYGVKYQITALFHDLLEDTDATEEEIEKIGGKEVLTAVKLLTKIKPYVMEEYIGKIKQNDMAKVIKAADRLHNLRCAVVASEDFKRRYVLETLDYFMDFGDDIHDALKALVKTMDKPLKDLPLKYRVIEKWIK